MHGHLPYLLFDKETAVTQWLKILIKLTSHSTMGYVLSDLTNYVRMLFRLNWLIRCSYTFFRCCASYSYNISVEYSIVKYFNFWFTYVVSFLSFWHCTIFWCLFCNIILYFCSDHRKEVTQYLYLCMTTICRVKQIHYKSVLKFRQFNLILTFIY